MLLGTNGNKELAALMTFSLETVFHFQSLYPQQQGLHSALGLAIICW
jgi:hypothetical protein